MKIFNIIIFAFLLSNVQSQETYVFEYDYTFKKDTLSDKTFTEHYLLVDFDNNNFFISESDLNVFESENELNKKYEGSVVIRGSSKNIRPQRLKSLKINQKGDYAFFRNYFNKIKVKYNENVALNWHLTNDTISYKGYKCNIATTSYSGREYKAYFTKTIPYNFGPYVFNGLPGLIVYLADSSENHVFELSEITKRSFNFLMKDFIDVSKSKFNEIEYDYRTNPMRLLIPNSTTISSQKKQEIKRKLKERLKKENNPIELL